MSWELTSPNTGDSLAALAPNAVRELWQKGVDLFEHNNDFFAPFEGMGMDSIVQTKTDTSKGRGQKINFTTGSGLYDEPHEGEELFDSSDDFEEILLGSNSLEVDWLRHAVRFTERSEEKMGMRGELVAQIPMQLGEWLGRIKSERLFMLFKERLPTDNIVYAGEASGLDDLQSHEVLNWDEILSMGVQGQRVGMLAGRVAAMGRKAVRKRCVIGVTDSLFSLESDPTYKQYLLEGGKRGEGLNYIFTDEFADVRNNCIVKYNPIDHDGEGAVGSPWNPKAFLGGAIVAGTGTFDILGGGNATAAAKTKKKYFKYFPNYAYKFGPSDTLSQDGDTHYLLIYNMTGADAGKMNMYAYTTGNNGNKITITQRLNDTETGAGVTTLGGVTWNTGIWSGKHTKTHPIGSLIIPCTKNGVPFADSVMLGRMAARRGYGKFRNRRSEESHEGGFVKDIFITSVFGQALRKDRLDRVPGAIRLRHAIEYAGLKIPSYVVS